MPKRMLIDSSHPEETRVVVLDGQKVEEFDFEAASKRPLKGNIYLAKVTRVEPSLQAAFVEYGGNRQGFLAFSEIHPDYYQIPVADRIALLAEQEADARRRSEDEFEPIETASAPAQDSAVADTAAEEDWAASLDGAGETTAQSRPDAPEADESGDEVNGEPAAGPGEFVPLPDEETHSGGDEPESQLSATSEGPPSKAQNDAAQAKTVLAPRSAQRWARRRHYKIQEVIKRRQIILVQVVKEERGTKGAALTTYLSLAGRYCVLMPNTPRGGGISRKITNATDRKRLKSAAQSLELPEGMGLIIRTAGENRTKVEIKRDYEYLLRMWDTVRELTLKSNAPACVYEEGDLIKRAIRDLYNKDVTEIVVEGDDGYRNAKDFMRMLMPSHAKNVKPFKEAVPLFQRHHIEAQLDSMFQPSVTLRSGGYIVINQTEALVAIDVNSGRATREHSIEDTASKTNLEAAEEISRQLRLRDLAGLIVIDFIDMEDGRNDRNVEKRLRDCVKNDRARVQIGKISQFGLLEMSRQRLRAGVVAGSTVPCPHCGGQGIVRSVESTALRVLRAVEEEGQKQRATSLCVHAPGDVVIYTLNQKRRELARIESEYSLTIQFEPKDGVVAGSFEIDRAGQRPPDDRPRLPPPAEIAAPALENAPEDDVVVEATDDDPSEDTTGQSPQANPDGQTAAEPPRRKRRRRRRGRDRNTQTGAPNSNEPMQAGSPSTAMTSQDHSPDENGMVDVRSEKIVVTNFATAETGIANHNPGETGETAPRRKRRRRRRGRRSSSENMSVGEAQVSPDRESATFVPTAEPARDSGQGEPYAAPNAPSMPVWSLSQESAESLAPKQTPHRVGATPATNQQDAPRDFDTAEMPTAAASSGPAPPSNDPSPQSRKGWWQRPFRARD